MATVRIGLLVVLVAGCGAESAENNSTDAEIRRAARELIRDRAAAGAAGEWTGVGVFEQTVAGQTSRADVTLNLVMDAGGRPQSLPALGFISPWHVYVPAGAAPPIHSPAEVLELGGIAYAACPGEADGPANPIDITEAAVAVGDATISWRYRAKYRFADLITYQLYDYQRPDAPTVALIADDVFQLSGDGTAQALTVRSQASGTMATGQSITLRLDGQLVRGKALIPLRCKIGT